MDAEDISPARLAEMLDGGDGQVTVADPEALVRAAWRRAIDGVRRQGLVSAGLRLRHTGRDRGDLVVWLEADDGQVTTRPDPLPVPEEVTEVHPLLGSADHVAERLDMEVGSVERALRLLQVLIEAAEARHFTVAWAAEFSTLSFERDGHAEPVRVFEEREHREVLPDAAELGDDAPRYSWQRVQTVRRPEATGRLCLQVGDLWDRRGRRNRWADRARWSLEDKLADVLGEVERRTDAEAEDRRAKERRAREREAQWREAMAGAREAFVEQRRRDELLRQVEAREGAKRVRAYGRALMAALDAGEHPSPRGEVEAWAEWARTYADAIDPIVIGALAPEEAEPSADQLRPFLGGWSPLGPEQG